MLSIALYQPEIPPNTGNIIRLCANTGIELHLIRPLGFELADKQLKRAGLDYHEWAHIQSHESFSAFIEQIGRRRVFACSTRGTQAYTDICYQPDDVLLFGPETRGLPAELLTENVIRIPMLATSRSLNLSNAVSVVAYEALRQIGFTQLSLK